MRKIFLMLTVSLFSLEAAATTCTPTPDCASLGYKYSLEECENMAVKCPSGDSYYCPSPRPKCNIGDIFYSDNTCVPAGKHDRTKTVLGIVFYVNSDGVGGQIMAPWSVDEYGKPVENNNTLIAQSIRNVSVPGLYACPAGTYVCQKMVDSCNTTNIIVAAGGANTYPAAWAAKRYAPTPETAGKWCLPAGFMLLGNMNRYRSIFDISISVINASYFPTQMWSSSQTGDGSFWALEDDNILSHYKMTTKLPVRPVMEF